MTSPQPDPTMQRSPEQASHERAMGEVSDVLLNVEHALSRAKKALKNVAKSGGEPNVELALTEAVRDLDKVRKRLMQDTYFAGDAIRLL